MALLTFVYFFFTYNKTSLIIYSTKKNTRKYWTPSKVHQRRSVWPRSLSENFWNFFPISPSRPSTPSSIFAKTKTFRLVFLTVLFVFIFSKFERTKNRFDDKLSKICHNCVVIPRSTPPKSETFWHNYWSSKMPANCSKFTCHCWLWPR